MAPPNARGLSPYWKKHGAWFRENGMTYVHGQRAYFRFLNTVQRASYIRIQQGIDQIGPATLPPRAADILQAFHTHSESSGTKSEPSDTREMPVGETAPSSRLHPAMLPATAREVIAKVLVNMFHEENGRAEEDILLRAVSLRDHLTRGGWHLALWQMFAGLGYSPVLRLALRDYVPPSPTLFISIDTNAIRHWTQNGFSWRWAVVDGMLWHRTNVYVTEKIRTNTLWGPNFPFPHIPVPNGMQNFCWQAWYRVRKIQDRFSSIN
jgi:hypothetical protein